MKFYSLRLFNILGENVRTISNISSNKIILKRENLKTGVYFFQLQSAKERMSGKIIIK